MVKSIGMLSLYHRTVGRGSPWVRHSNSTLLFFFETITEKTLRNRGKPWGAAKRNEKNPVNLTELDICFGPNQLILNYTFGPIRVGHNNDHIKGKHSVKMGKVLPTFTNGFIEKCLSNHIWASAWVRSHAPLQRFPKCIADLRKPSMNYKSARIVASSQMLLKCGEFDILSHHESCLNTGKPLNLIF